MYSGKRKLFILLLICLYIISPAVAQSISDVDEDTRVLKSGVRLLERYFDRNDFWHVIHPETGESVLELIHFIKKQPLDSTLNRLNSALKDSSFRFVYRLPKNVSDSLSVPGYYTFGSVQEDLAVADARLRKKYFQDELAVPMSLLSGLDERAGTIPPGQGRRLFEAGVYQLPDSLQLPDIIPDSLMQSPADFRHFLKLDSIRNHVMEEKRLAYNDSVVTAYRDSIIEAYRQQNYQNELADFRQKLVDSVKFNNYQVLKDYNDLVVSAVNDSILVIVENLTQYADFIDTTRVSMTNLLDDEFSILLQNGNPYFSRVWLKNEQNDSLRIMVKSLDKRSMQLLIDDGVTFSRFKTKESKEFDFSSLNRSVGGLTGVAEKYQVLTPWRLGGNETVGFSQTYLENWKKGGQSALSLQIVLKGFANYSSADEKVKWENSAEIRNGYIRPGGEGAELQKNDDKFEVTSRFGLSAFKKWYYGAEFNYETQFFNGYRYPTATHPEPISAFMAPARAFFKVGLDYKPNKNFSLFLSPITAKNVYVRDTMKIDQTKFGIDRGKRSFWEPGLNTDIAYKKDITPEISYETKFKMFINYIQPWGNLDFNWENLVVMQLTDHINMRLLVHMIYDENVLFPVYDANDVKIDEKPKLQLREFFSIGFSYKINRQVTRTRRR